MFKYIAIISLVIIMAIATSTTEYDWLGGTMNVTVDATCVDALIQISQDGLPFVKLSNEGAGIVAGILPADNGTQLTDLSKCKVKFTFTGTDVISFLPV